MRLQSGFSEVTRTELQTSMSSVESPNGGVRGVILGADPTSPPLTVQNFMRLSLNPNPEFLQLLPIHLARTPDHRLSAF